MLLLELWLATFVASSFVSGWNPNPAKIELKPVIRFADLHLRLLCNRNEWQDQLFRVKSKWTKCLGLRRILLPNEEMPGEPMERRLHFHMTTSEQSSNAYCRLSDNWKSCVHHLSKANCFIANVDVIALEKDPKFTALHRRPNYRTVLVNSATDEDRLERMVELYQMRCDTARLSQQYMPPYWLFDLAELNQHLSPDYDDDDDDHALRAAMHEL